MKSKNYTKRRTLRAVDHNHEQLKYLLKFGDLTKDQALRLYKLMEELFAIRVELVKECPNPYGEWRKYVDRLSKGAVKQNRKRLAREARRIEKAETQLERAKHG